ncbi:MAG: hypothetical protein U0075_08605 [Thermomicrobiales bacterium]
MALLIAAERMGLASDEIRDPSSPVFAEIPFEPVRQYSASVRGGDSAFQIFSREGAPERIMAMCSDMLGPGGPTPLDVDEIRLASRGLGAQGLRVLAMAYRTTRSNVAGA